MSIATTHKDIIHIKEQIKQLSSGIPTFDGSLYSQTGHTHSINDITALTATLAGKQDTLIAGDNITIVDNRISSTGGGGTSIWNEGTDIISYIGSKSVGIGGTTAPKFFSIWGNAYIYSDLTMVNGNNGYSTTKNQFVFGYNGGQSYRHCIKTRHEATAIPKKNAIDFYIWTSGQTFDAIGDTHGMSITAAGVGIGKIEPQYKLDVDGDINLTGNLLVGGINKLQFLDATSTIQGQLSEKASAIHTHAINDITNLTTTLSNKQDKLTAGTNISFVGNTINALGGTQWASGSGGIISYNGGNVGIGVTDPVNKLAVNGTFRLLDGFSQSANGTFAVDSVGVIGGRVHCLVDGNFGINKPAPEYKLDVDGDINYTGTLRKSGVVQNTLSKHLTFTALLTIATHTLTLSTFFTGGNIISGVYNLSICDNDIAYETTQYCIGMLVVWDSKIVTIVVHKQFTLGLSWNATNVFITNNGGKQTLFRKTLSRVNDF